jgi:hypothetical protein
VQQYTLCARYHFLRYSATYCSILRINVLVSRSHIY